MDELASLRAQVAQLQVDCAVALVAIQALIASHPDRKQAHIALTRALESQLAAGADGLTQALSDDQRDEVREAVEWLGAVRPLKPRS